MLRSNKIMISLALIISLIAIVGIQAQEEPASEGLESVPEQAIEQLQQLIPEISGDGSAGQDGVDTNIAGQFVDAIAQVGASVGLGGDDAGADAGVDAGAGSSDDASNDDAASDAGSGASESDDSNLLSNFLNVFSG